jgi:hypothetical protein
MSLPYPCTSNFAGCDEQQSGQRFLDSSAPRLKRHVASREAAGGGCFPLPAGKDEKLSREFEGRALIGREAPVSPLLDSVTNNRHTGFDYYARPAGRGKHCGRFSIKGIDPKTQRVIHRRVNCGSWTCSYCGTRKARLAKKRIREEASKLGLCYFWTLTLAPRDFHCAEERVRHIRQVFNKFREYLKRRFGIALTYICVLEFTQRGIPHLHILFDTFIPHEWVSETWDRLGGGSVVWVKRVTVGNVARYLSKYLTKDLLLAAPKGARRITTSRKIRLFPKFQTEIVWEFIRDSVWQLLVTHRAGTCALQEDLFRFTLLHSDEEGYLKCFEIVSDESFAAVDAPQCDGT